MILDIAYMLECLIVRNFTLIWQSQILLVVRCWHKPYWIVFGRCIGPWDADL